MAQVQQKDGAAATSGKKAAFKRLIFCFDGTWNKLGANTPTNVVLTAASIERITADGIAQIIHYDEGVGTGVREKYTGGIFGAGLDVNLHEAYRFLLFNYDPGDHIGFSALFGHRFTVGSISANSFRVSIKKMPQPRSFCESRESAKSASEPSALLITHYSVEPTSR